jgi:hypothetical protein
MKKLKSSFLVFLFVISCSFINNVAQASWLSEVLGVDINVNKAATKTLDLCGVEIVVNAALYQICSATIAAIPVSCTVGQVTAGTACAVNIGAAAGACSVSIATLAKGAEQCIKKAG